MTPLVAERPPIVAVDFSPRSSDETTRCACGGDRLWLTTSERDLTALRRILRFHPRFPSKPYTAARPEDFVYPQGVSGREM